MTADEMRAVLDRIAGCWPARKAAAVTWWGLNIAAHEALRDIESIIADARANLDADAVENCR